MLVCITEQRVLIWRISGLHLPLKLRGTIGDKRVQATQLARSTHVHWNVITLDIDRKQEIRLLIDQPSAIPFAKVLNARVDEQMDPGVPPT